MITVTLTQEEIAERARSLAQYANRLAELADEEEGAKARHKQLMADIKERRLDISNELRRLSRAVRLGVEERTTQRVLFDEEKRKEEFRKEREAEEQQQAAEAEQGDFHAVAKPITEEERESLHQEAVATWRRERFIVMEPVAEGRSGEGADDGEGFNPGFPPGFDADRASEGSGQADEGADYQAEWLASLTNQEREKYFAAPCRCGHSRDWHGEDGRETCDKNCAFCKNCDKFHCEVCDTKGGHQATCEHYIRGEGTPVQDDFTAPICDECKRIDGGHTPECSHSNALRFDDYLAYATAHYKSNYNSHARKMELSKLADDKVREWKQQQAGNGVAKIETEGSPDPRILCWCKHKYADHRNGTFCKKKNCGCNSFSWAGEAEKKPAKLSPVEAAIDR